MRVTLDQGHQYELRFTQKNPLSWHLLPIAWRIQIRFKIAEDIFGEDRIWLLFPSWILVAFALSPSPYATPRIRPKGLPQGWIPRQQRECGQGSFSECASLESASIKFLKPQEHAQKEAAGTFGNMKNLFVAALTSYQPSELPCFKNS